MTLTTRPLAIAAVSCATIGAAVAASGPAAAVRPTPIQSGAGPGWPSTLTPRDFVARVTNPYYPLIPGSVYRYAGLDGATKTTDVVSVTHRTRTILGVRTTVVHDVVSVRGRPTERTDDFYVQDRRGNVWYFGEDTATLDADGRVKSREGSFIAGRRGARPGVLVPRRPRVGQTGRQESLKGLAEDQFKILSLHAAVSVPFVSSTHALRTEETSPIEPGVVDNKFYVRGIGSVREVTVKGPKELLRLVAYRKGRG